MLSHIFTYEDEDDNNMDVDDDNDYDHDDCVGINYFGPHRPVYRILVAIWIFLGLAWLAGIVSSIQETFQNLAKEVEAKSIFRRSTEKVNLVYLHTSK